MPASVTEFDRNAVITIQGGGLHALNLLGQLDAAMQSGFVPLALAGTSAGAIVATLLWAKLSPSVARDRIIAMANPSLSDLLGPFQRPPKGGFRFEQFRALADDLEQAIQGMKSYAGGAKPRLRAMPGLFLRLHRLVGTIAPHAGRRGFFVGEKLEEEIDLILRSAPDFKKYCHELTDLGPWPDRVRFRHFRQLADAHPECYRPPLFLAVTNLTTRRLELLNSVDDACLPVAVATAARASASFPFFFAPSQGIEGGCYVDGGVVSNFPAWIFTQEFRRRMDAAPQFQGLSMRPWVHLGLRVVDDPPAHSTLEQPVEYLSSLLAMLRGQSRNELEDRLAERVPRSKLINQPVADTQAPSHMLSFDEVGKTVIDKMYNAGRDFAQKALAPLSFALPSGAVAKSIEDELRRLVATAGRIFVSTPSIKFRANVFVPSRGKLVLQYSVNMQGDPDENMVLSVNAGLTGACFTTRCPLICNLAKVRELVTAGAIRPAELFNMTSAEQSKVEPKRTWLASVPVFDPFDATTTPDSRRARGLPLGYSYYQLESHVDGAMLGVLNLDADWSYPSLSLAPDPEIHFTDPRVQDILDLMRVASLRVGHVLGASFGA
jgi:predicted acylesterase/phospholipase RssA